jgi:hypothetical protein
MLKTALVTTATVATILVGAAPAMASPLITIRATAVLPPSPDGVYPGRAAVDAKCPEGWVLTGGGAFVRAGDSHTDLVDLDSSYPRNDSTWWAHGKNMSTSAGTIEAYAICARKGVHIVP